MGERLLAENGLTDKDAFVYAQVSRGAAPRYHAFPAEGTAPTVFAFAREVDPPPPPDGGKAILLTDERWGRCDIKSVMLLPNVLAAQKAREAGAIDAILVRDGFALEGTKANLFMVAKGVLRTAPNGPRILPGVTRAAAIEAGRRIGLDGRGARLHGRGDVRGAGGLLRLDDALDVSDRLRRGPPDRQRQGRARDADDPRRALRGVPHPRPPPPAGSAPRSSRRSLRARRTSR